MIFTMSLLSLPLLNGFDMVIYVTGGGFEIEKKNKISKMKRGVCLGG